MLLKNSYKLFLDIYNLNHNYTKVKATYTNRVSIGNPCLSALIKKDFKALNVFKKIFFIGMALDLGNWEKFKYITNLSLSSMYWHAIKGYSCFYG